MPGVVNESPENGVQSTERPESKGVLSLCLSASVFPLKVGGLQHRGVISSNTRDWTGDGAAL